MCSFLVSSWLLTNLTYVNFFMRPRGPDLTTRGSVTRTNGVVRRMERLRSQDGEVMISGIWFGGLAIVQGRWMSPIMSPEWT